MATVMWIPSASGGFAVPVSSAGLQAMVSLNVFTTKPLYVKAAHVMLAHTLDGTKLIIGTNCYCDCSFVV